MISRVLSGGKVRSNFIGLRNRQRQAQEQRGGRDSRSAREQVVSHHPELRDDAQDVQAHSPGEEEVPELEHFVEWGRTGAEGEEGGEGVEFGGEVGCEEVVVEGKVEGFETEVDELLAR